MSQRVDLWDSGCEIFSRRWIGSWIMNSSVAKRIRNGTSASNTAGGV